MAISTSQLCEEWAKAKGDTKAALYSLVMQSLSPLEWRAYMLIKDNPMIDSADLGERMELPLNHVGGILKRLHTWGLVQRSRQGKNECFQWWVTPATLSELRKDDPVCRVMEGPRGQLWCNDGHVVAVTETEILCTINVDVPRSMSFDRETGLNTLGGDYGWLEISPTSQPQ